MSVSTRGCIGKGKLPRSQADIAGHESPGEDCGRPHQTVSVDDSQFGFVPGRGTTDAICVEEWIVRLVMVRWEMYANALSRVLVGEGYSEEFEVKVGVHKDSVLSPLLFIIVLEALSREFHSGVPWEYLYADDLVIITESLE